MPPKKDDPGTAPEVSCRRGAGPSCPVAGHRGASSPARVACAFAGLSFGTFCDACSPAARGCRATRGRRSGSSLSGSSPSRTSRASSASTSRAGTRSRERWRISWRSWRRRSRTTGAGRVKPVSQHGMPSLACAHARRSRSRRAIIDLLTQQAKASTQRMEEMTAQKDKLTKELEDVRKQMKKELEELRAEKVRRAASYLVAIRQFAALGAPHGSARRTFGDVALSAGREDF